MSQFLFKLYVAGTGARSMQAVANLRRLCERELGGLPRLEVIDVVENPAAAEAERILTTPTLVKEAPGPVRRVTGDLSDPQRVLVGLALETGLRLQPPNPPIPPIPPTTTP